MGVQETLKDLFLIDQQVRGLESRLTSARSHVTAQQTKLEKLAAEHDALAKQLQLLKATEANLETEATGYDERIAKLHARLVNQMRPFGSVAAPYG